MALDYRLYIDEAGDHTACSDPYSPIGKRFLGLAGVVMARGKLYEGFVARMEDFKRAHLPYDPDDPPILHREDIVNRRGVYRVLQDETKRAAFDAGLLDLVQASRCMVITVVLDKQKHGLATYRKLSEPYHYCLLGMLERYCGWLKYMNLRGDVMVESRGGSEDQAFKAAFEDLYDNGSGASGYLSKATAQQTLTSRTPKLKKKEKNIAGLQLADMLAHPLTRDVLMAYGLLTTRGSAFADRICAVAGPKYNRQLYRGTVKGYGQVFL